MRFREGQIVAGRYRVDRLVGTGSGAEVYQVWDSQRSARLALKLLRTDLGKIPDLVNRFQDEANALSHLQHPNIVRFYELASEGGFIFILMDFIQGKTLRHELHQTNQPYKKDKILAVFNPVCTALQYAHHQSIIHCDVKPENILIDQSGRVLLNDFGIALMSGTYSGVLGGVGTPAYMAPEQIRDEGVSSQTDQYAIGIIFYELVTGSKPFNGSHAPSHHDSNDRIRWEQLNLQPVPPSKINPHLSSEVDAIVLKCLEKDPHRRFPDVLALLHAMDSMTYGVGNLPAGTVSRPAAVPDIGNQPSSAIIKRKRTILFIGGAFVIAIILIILSSFGNFRGASTQITPMVGNLPKTYPYSSACMDILVTRQPETTLSECVTSITLLSNGKIKVNVSWKVASLSNLSGVVIQPDTDNHNMYLMDDLGNRMDHIETGGDTKQKVELFNGQSKEGWFLFPTPNPSASSFYFVDDDNGVRSPRLLRQWP